MDYIFYYKIVCLTVGLIITYLGYKLFVKGIFAESGNLEAVFKNNKLIIKKALPGTYFVVLGTIIIVCTIFNGLSSEETTKHLWQKNHSSRYNDTLPKLDDSFIIKK